MGRIALVEIIIFKNINYIRCGPLNQMSGMEFFIEFNNLIFKFLFLIFIIKFNGNSTNQKARWCSVNHVNTLRSL